MGLFVVFLITLSTWGNEMNLEKFSKVNLKRCTSPEGFNHSLESWSEAEWTNAMQGEYGELLEIVCLLGASLGKASNLTKKLLRHRDGVAGNVKPDDQDIDYLARQAAEEIADVIIYADLAMHRLGFNTSEMVVGVFNRKSEQLGCPIKFIEPE
jgi:hypothetical protein